jgi:Ser/Thr protein kinase RdoA (MazF antagonist)
VIHGDYGLHNLLFRKDGTVIPIDFELARLEWRLSDLVSCMSRLRYGDGAYDFQSIRWFLAAYDVEHPLSDDEWRLFPEVWRFYKLQGAVQYWSSYFETGGPARKLIAARDALEQAARVADDPGGLLAQLRGSPTGDA